MTSVNCTFSIATVKPWKEEERGKEIEGPRRARYL